LREETKENRRLSLRRFNYSTQTDE